MQEKKFDVITSGYVSMDRIVKLLSPAQVGFTSLIENGTCSDICYGGCSVNISYDLCRLGVASVPIMRVGGDYEEIGFRRFLEEAGISLEATTVIPEERTSVCYLLQDNEGQHITLFHPGAMDGRLARPLPDELFTGARLGVMAVGSRADNELFLAMCKKHELPLVFSMKDDMDAFPRELLEELLHYSSIIFTNEVERDTIESMFAMDMTSLLEEGNCQLLVTTLGKDGSKCYYKENGQLREVFAPVCEHRRLQDTTGTGDAYVAGFLYGYLKGKAPLECAMLGTVLSSYVLEEEGCCTGAPTEEQLLERYCRFAQVQKGEN